MGTSTTTNTSSLNSQQHQNDMLSFDDNRRCNKSNYKVKQHYIFKINFYN